MPTLGQELRKKREEHGSSLKDVSLHTKITLRWLQALEDDRFDLLPELFFLKGVLRSYVRAIGADEKYFMGRLAELTSSEGPSQFAPPFEERVPRRRRRGLWIAALVIVLAVLAAGGYFLLKTRPAPAPIVKPPAAEAPPIKLPEAEPAAAPIVESVKVPAAPLEMEMSFTANTWLNIKADGTQVFEGVKTPGETTVFKAEKELLLQIGNAGGFKFKLNGKPGKPLGGLGVVKTDVRITPAALADFQNEPAAAPTDL